MAAHAMTSPADPRPRPHPNLLRRVGLVFAVSILAAAGLAVVYLLNRTIVPSVLSAAAVVGAGLISGFAARWILRPHTWVLRLATALATLVIALLLLGLMTRGASGLAPTNFWKTSPNWIGLAQLTLGAVTAWLALRAWPAPRPPSHDSAATPPAHPAPVTPLPVWQRPLVRIQEFGEDVRIRWKKSDLFHWLDNTRVRVSQPRAVEAQQNRVAVDASAPPSHRGRAWSRLRWNVQWPWSRNRAGLKFVGVTEHKCPFCLQSIEPNDRVVTCKICNTPHHADCWAITGVCQIPHYHN